MPLQTLTAEPSEWRSDAKLTARRREIADNWKCAASKWSEPRASKRSNCVDLPAVISCLKVFFLVFWDRFRNFNFRLKLSVHNEIHSHR